MCVSVYVCVSVYANFVIASPQHGRNVFVAAELLVDTYVPHKSLGTFGLHVCAYRCEITARVCVCGRLPKYLYLQRVLN